VSKVTLLMAVSSRVDRSAGVLTPSYGERTSSPDCTTSITASGAYQYTAGPTSSRPGSGARWLSSAGAGVHEPGTRGV
jgi:hypothetical protein